MPLSAIVLLLAALAGGLGLFVGVASGRNRRHIVEPAPTWEQSTEHGGGVLVALVLCAIVSIIGFAWFLHDAIWSV